MPAVEYSFNDVELYINGNLYTGTINGLGVRKTFNPLANISYNADFVLKFPCSVKVVDETLYGIPTQIAQDAEIQLVVDQNDETLVHLIPQYRFDKNKLYSGLSQLYWPAGDVCFSGFLHEKILPKSGKWSNYVQIQN